MKHELQLSLYPVFRGMKEEGGLLAGDAVICAQDGNTTKRGEKGKEAGDRELAHEKTVREKRTWA